MMVNSAQSGEVKGSRPPPHSIYHHVQSCDVRCSCEVRYSYFSSTLFSSVANNARISESIPPTPGKLENEVKDGDNVTGKDPRDYKSIIASQVGGS
jgi:hypothetical protein